MAEAARELQNGSGHRLQLSRRKSDLPERAADRPTRQQDASVVTRSRNGPRHLRVPGRREGGQDRGPAGMEKSRCSAEPSGEGRRAMRYAICLAQDVLLLIVLLRITYLGLHAQRRLMFLFLCAWFVACVAGLFCAQVMDISSPRYAAIFFSCSAAAWACGIPEISRASFVVARSAWHAA